MRFTPLQWIVHAAAWFVLAWLILDAITGNLTANPIQAATQRTGKTALVFLVFSLACTPLTSLGFRQVGKVRRALGLYAFLFAAGHLTLFAVVDYQLQWNWIWLDSKSKAYIWVGLVALVILATLALTSFQWWMKRMGKNWKRLHRLVYLAGILVVFHYAWVKKGNLLTLSGDIVQPLFFAGLVVMLLVMRLPGIRARLNQIGNRIKSVRLLPRPGA